MEGHLAGPQRTELVRRSVRGTRAEDFQRHAGRYLSDPVALPHFGPALTPLPCLAGERIYDERFRAWDSRSQRLGASPESIAAAVRAGFQRDVRDLLPTLCLPTLIVHREGDRFIRAGAGRYLAEHIAGARYVELPGDDHVFFVSDADAPADEIEEFLTGTHQAPGGDVVTSTTLFTDIVSSTEQSARMGHRRWTKLSDHHDAMVRTTLGRYRGPEVKTIGDGFLATFDSTTRAVHTARQIVTTAQTMRKGVPDEWRLFAVEK